MGTFVGIDIIFSQKKVRVMSRRSAVYSYHADPLNQLSRIVIWVFIEACYSLDF